MNREQVIKDLIKKRGLSLRSFAEEVGIPYTTLYSMLNRGIGKASVDTVIKVCKALDITTDRLELLAQKDALGDQEEIETIAAHNDGPPLTKEEQHKLEEYAKFLISQRKEKD